MSWQQLCLMWQLTLHGQFLINNLTLNRFSDGFAEQKVHHWLQRELVSVSENWSYDNEFSFELHRLQFRAHMKLTIKSLSVGDFGNYRCISKNSLGETEGSIRVYGENHDLIHCFHRITLDWISRDSTSGNAVETSDCCWTKRGWVGAKIFTRFSCATMKA